MSNFRKEFPSVSALCDKILKDINFFRNLGHSNEDILISMPNHMKEFISDFLISHYYSGIIGNYITPKYHFFGCKVVEGYNHQVCVFLKNEKGEGPYCEPFIMKNCTINQN